MNDGIKAAVKEIHDKYGLDCGILSEILYRHLTQCNEAKPVLDESGHAQILDNMMYECCDDPILYLMKDKYHEFAMGLITIISCLKIAEQAGHVPKLPNGWWCQLVNRYK